MGELMPIYEVRMPSQRGAMMVRVIALNETDARESAVHWFTEEPDGPRDTIDGEVMVQPVSNDPPPFWATDEVKALWAARDSR